MRKRLPHLFGRIQRNAPLLLRFSLVGGSGVVVNLLVFGLLLGLGAEAQEPVLPLGDTEFNVRWYHAFSTIAFLVANLWNFELNRVWTFQSAGRAPWLREYVPFLTVGIAAQGFGLIVLTLLLRADVRLSLFSGLLDGSSVLRSRELWAQALTIAIVTPISFLGNKLWTFRVVRGSRRTAEHLDVLRRDTDVGSRRARAVQSD